MSQASTIPGSFGIGNQLFLQEAKQSISKRKASDAASPALDAAAASATAAAEDTSPSKRMKAASDCADPSQVHTQARTHTRTHTPFLHPACACDQYDVICICIVWIMKHMLTASCCQQDTLAAILPWLGMVGPPGVGGGCDHIYGLSSNYSLRLTGLASATRCSTTQACNSHSICDCCAAFAFVQDMPMSYC